MKANITRTTTRYYLLALVLLAFIAGNVSAGTISGRTIDIETKSRIRDVNVSLVESGKVVASDKRGEYEILNLPDGTYYLVATHVAYDQSDTIKVVVTGDVKVEFSLVPSPWVLDDVVVTGTRSPHLLKDVPVQTEVVTARDFQRTGATTVDEALSSSIGIAINEDLSGQGATIRGIEGDRVLVLVDGERAVGRVRGTLDLSQYSLSNVEKIEIVKGTGSTLYGSDAMGGVINIITKKPEKQTIHGMMTFDAGSHSTIDPSASLNYGNQKGGLILGGRYYSTSGFDLDNSTPHTDGIEDIARVNLDGKLQRKLSNNWSSTVSARYMHETKKWIESEEFPSFTLSFNDVEKNSRTDGSISFDYLSGDSYSMKFRLFASLYDHVWTKALPGEEPDDGDISQTEDHFIEASYSSNYVIGQNHVATYGIEYYFQDLESSELVSEAEGDRSSSLYFQYEYSPSSNWVFLPGIRYEKHSSFGGQWNPSFNVMYSLDEGIKLRGFVGRGFRAPSMKQLYFIFDHSAWGYIVYGGNAIPDQYKETGNFDELREETSLNSSISIEMSYGTVGLHRLTYFYNDLDGLIDFIPIDSPLTGPYRNGIYAYQNIDDAITQGIEWESRIRLSSWLDFSFSYNYLYSRNLGTGYKLFSRPDHTGQLFVTGFLENSGVGASFWGTYTSRKLWITRESTGGSDPKRALYTPHQTTLNLNIFKRLGNGVELYVRLENLLDETNVDFHYWPGLEIFAGFKYNIGNVD